MKNMIWAALSPEFSSLERNPGLASPASVLGQGGEGVGEAKRGGTGLDEVELAREYENLMRVSSNTLCQG